MFWRSVVGKLAVTILLLVAVVLFILTILLLEFFENFHIDEAEEDMLRTAEHASTMVESYDDTEAMLHALELVKDPQSGLAIYFGEDDVWYSRIEDENLLVKGE